MDVQQPHRWDLTPKEAIALQRELAQKVNQTEAIRGMPRLIAGADVSSSKFSDQIYCGVVVADSRTWEVVETAQIATKTSLPYIPGLLSFREAPGLLEAFAQLRCTPDLIVVDGAGLAHPRRFGIGCHLGVLLDIPTIGCAKTRLIGDYLPLREKRGSYRTLMHHCEAIGRVLRTRDGVNPLFISVGHRIRLTDATRIILSCSTNYRQPEPIRLAHHHVNELRRADGQA